MERTLIILKPDAVQRGLSGEILSRFERVGLKIIGIKMMQPSREDFYEHYEAIGKMISRRGQAAFDVTLEMMTEGPVIAAVLEGVEAVSLVRKMVGTTEPKSAQPGTIRGDYAHVSFGFADQQHAGVPNVVHASGDPNEAEQEINLWFSGTEIYEYDTVHDLYTQIKHSKYVREEKERAKAKKESQAKK